MKYLLLLLTFLAGCCSHMPAAHPPQEFVAINMEEQTVALVQERDDGTLRPYCAAVWVGQNVILTAGHCVAHREDEFSPVGDVVNFSTKPDFDNGIDRVALVAAYNFGFDLAVLKTAAAPALHNIAKVAGGLIVPGQRVYVMGHPSGLVWNFTSGDITALRTQETFGVPVLKIQTSAPIWFGNSGGGMFNQEGELIGIASTLSMRTPAAAFFIHRDYISKILACVAGGSEGKKDLCNALAP